MNTEQAESKSDQTQYTSYLEREREGNERNRLVERGENEMTRLIERRQGETSMKERVCVCVFDRKEWEEEHRV